LAFRHIFDFPSIAADADTRCAAISDIMMLIRAMPLRADAISMLDTPSPFSPIAASHFIFFTPSPLPLLSLADITPLIIALSHYADDISTY
jgi:hypothetical protein